MSKTANAPEKIACPHISRSLKDDLGVSLEVCQDALRIIYDESLGVTSLDAGDRIPSVLFLVLEHLKQVEKKLNETNTGCE